MTPEEILSYPAKILTQEQREHYFEYGFVGIEDFVPSETLNLIKKVTNEYIEKSQLDKGKDFLMKLIDTLSEA